MSNGVAQIAAVDDRERWWALLVLCLGHLMIAINTTIVNVALPSIKLDLRFSDAALVWVVNAYLVPFGSFLLLGGRLADLFGHRRLFLLGIGFFTLTSLGCGLATSPGLLVTARAGQGLGGAIVSAVALSQIMNLFAEAPKRVKALGIYVFVSASGSSIGLLLGGTLASTLGWQWVFFVNIPLGAVVCTLCLSLLSRGSSRSTRGRLDVAGAMTVTTSLMLAIYAIVNVNQAGWSSLETLTLLATAVALLVFFVGIEARVKTPLMPLDLFRIRNFTVVSIVGALLAAAVLAWSFFSALYLQLVLQFSPLQVGLTFLPANLTVAVMSLVVSPALVRRFGTKRPMVIGMLVASVGLAFLGQAPMSASVVLDVLPGMFLLGLGNGMAYNPLLLSALSSVPPYNSGAASGIVNTSFTMGGPLGLSVLVSIASAWTNDSLVSGAGLPFALNSGYQIAFCIGALFAALAAVISGVFLRSGQQLYRDYEDVGTETPRSIFDDAHP